MDCAVFLVFGEGSRQCLGALCAPFPSEVDKELLGFGDVEQQIVGSPHSQSLHLIQVGGLIPPQDKSHCGVISRSHDAVTVVLLLCCVAFSF